MTLVDGVLERMPDYYHENQPVFPKNVAKEEIKREISYSVLRARLFDNSSATAIRQTSEPFLPRLRTFARLEEPWIVLVNIISPQAGECLTTTASHTTVAEHQERKQYSEKRKNKCNLVRISMCHPTNLLQQVKSSTLQPPSIRICTQHFNLNQSKSQIPHPSQTVNLPLSLYTH